MSRDPVARLGDMIAAAQLVMAWTAEHPAAELAEDVGIRYQIERALEVLGEAAKHVPDEIRALAPEFPWRRACGLRDVLAHGYFEVDAEVLTSVGLHALPKALPALLALRNRLATPDGGHGTR